MYHVQYKKQLPSLVVLECSLWRLCYHHPAALTVVVANGPLRVHLPFTLPSGTLISLNIMIFSSDSLLFKT